MKYSPITLFPKCRLLGVALALLLAAPPIASQDQKVETHFKSAMTYYKAKNNADALTELDLALKATPQADTAASKKDKSAPVAE